LTAGVPPSGGSRAACPRHRREDAHRL